MIVVLALAVVLLIVAGVWYFRAYREAQEWPEVQGFWGREDREQAGVLRGELEKQGVRVKVKALGGPDLFRMTGQRFTSVRVHRDDYAHAASIVRSLRGR